MRCIEKNSSRTAADDDNTICKVAVFPSHQQSSTFSEHLISAVEKFLFVSTEIHERLTTNIYLQTHPMSTDRLDKLCDYAIKAYSKTVADNEIHSLIDFDGELMIHSSIERDPLKMKIPDWMAVLKDIRYSSPEDAIEIYGLNAERDLMSIKMKGRGASWTQGWLL